VQAAIGIEDPVEETKWLEAFAERLGVPHGIVAYVDLGADDAVEMIARHAAYPHLRGIRDLRYDDYLTTEAWQRGYAALEDFNLVCCDDPLVEVMADAAELAARHPGIVYCVDHAGFPRRRDREYFEAWRDGMRKLAAVENTVVKISGLGMVDHDWTVDSLRPWVHECIAAWGVERSFFGTNWPVDRLYSSYGDVLDAYRELVSDLTREEQVALFSGNADRIFRLG
jgi:predicted TIM-barrel fold metal-dependent hydrolase